MERNETSYTPITVDVVGLQKMLGVSKNTCLRIGKDANAVIRLTPRRTLYNVEKIKAYMDSITGDGSIQIRNNGQ